MSSAATVVRIGQNVKLAQDAYWCRKYAKANAVALRKILKKHDKLAHNDHGRDFLRDSWQPRGNAGVGIFLHSPLLDEIKAIQVCGCLTGARLG